MIAIVYLERKIAAFIQDRLGPMEVGYRGTLQTLADLLKLLRKEVLIPQASQQLLFKMAPVWILGSVILAFSVLPVTSSWLGVPTSVALLLLLAILSLKTIGILIAGWSSNNKFTRLGANRAVAQFLAYEIPLGLSVLCVVLVSQSLDLGVISAQQGLATEQCYLGNLPTSDLWGLKGVDVSTIGGFLCWNIFRIPCLIIAYAIFFVISLAVSNKIPFDLAEAESELIAGYHTEYSGIYWAWIMLAEYGVLWLMSMLGIILFLGSWHTPFPNMGWLKLATYTHGPVGTWRGSLWSFFWLFSKSFLVVIVQLWIKWSFPRLRADQLLKLCWLYLTPIGHQEGLSKLFVARSSSRGAAFESPEYRFMLEESPKTIACSEFKNIEPVNDHRPMQYKAFFHIISGLVKALQLTWQSLVKNTKLHKDLLKQPAYLQPADQRTTLQYPKEQLPVPSRGRYQLHNDIEDCIVCDKCAKVCPVDCIEIEAIPATEVFGVTSNGRDKRIYAAKFDIDMAKCCFCGLCTTVCPTACLTMKPTYDFSVFDVLEHKFSFANMSEAAIEEKKKRWEEHTVTQAVHNH
eukprot:gene234-313_t